MEKVKIKSCVKSETAKGITYYKIEAEDGRVGMTYDDLTSEIGNEIVNLMKENQIQKYELWLKYFRKEDFSKEAILEVITSEIERLKKQIEPQELQKQT